MGCTLYFEIGLLLDSYRLFEFLCKITTFNTPSGYQALQYLYRQNHRQQHKGSGKNFQGDSLVNTSYNTKFSIPVLRLTSLFLKGRYQTFRLRIQKIFWNMQKRSSLFDIMWYIYNWYVYLYAPERGIMPWLLLFLR